MKIIRLFIAFFLFALVTTRACTTRAESADEIIKEAKAEAAKTNKNIFVISNASWCIWYRRMDLAMNDATVKSFFDKNYVIKHLTVDESDDKKDLKIRSCRT